MTLIGSVASAGSGASIEPMMPVVADDDGVVAAGQRLRHGQHHGIARGKPIVGEVERRFGNDRHGGSRLDR